jgi:predicted ArsR family transcriptional regulator
MAHDQGRLTVDLAPTQGPGRSSGHWSLTMNLETYAQRLRVGPEQAKEYGQHLTALVDLVSDLSFDECLDDEVAEAAIAILAHVREAMFEAYGVEVLTFH